MLAGRYRLEGQVRTRPGGSLWRAVDETLDRPVLVQAFVLGHPYGPEIVDAARRAALVEDPRLQRVLAAGEERGTAYVVLERLPGRTLVDLLGTGPLPAESARRIVGEAAQALDRAAARGLHHLRLRPTSLVVAADGTVTVVGTAIDAAADGAESPNTPVATRSDAVGLVALLYAALTGRWPGAQDSGLARAPRVAGRPVPPGDLVAGVPNDLDTLCAVALGPHEDGPRTPGELAAQLSPWAAAAPLTDPRGLHLGAPTRPSQDGEGAPPVEAQPTEAPARRTPAWGLRVNRRSRPGPETGPQPVVTAGAPASPAATEAAASRSEGPQPGDNGPADGGNARPGWATVEELRRALRRTGAAVLPSGTPSGPVPGAGLPLAASAPPAGAPLSAGAAPAGAPLADAVAPAGPPTATPAPATDDLLGDARLDPRRDEAQDPAATVVMPPADTPAARRPATRGAPAESAPIESAPIESPPIESPPKSAPAPAAGPVQAAPPPRAAAHPPVPAPPVHAGRAHTGPAHTDPTPAGPAHAAAAPHAAAPHAAAPHAAAVPAGAAAAGATPLEQWYGNGHAQPGGRYGPGSGGVHGLEMFAAEAQPADPFEAVAPFGPEAPLTRPPREQSRLVLLIVAVLLVLAGVVAFRQLVSFHPAALITTGGGAPVTPPGAKPAPSASTVPSTAPAAPSPSASPVTVAGVQAIDPEGDNSENNDLAARAIDGDSSTAWRSERYNSPQFGGIKKGVGLAVDLGDPANVTGVTLTAPGSDGLVEVRSADSPDYNGSSRIASAAIDGSGHVVLTSGKPVTTRYLIVWFTRAPQQSNGENRVIVNEIDVR